MNIRYTIYFLAILFFSYGRNVSAQSVDTLHIDYRKPLFNFDYSKPIFALENEQIQNKNRHLTYSALSGYREGVEPIKDLVNFDSYVDNSTGTLRVYFINLSIQDILTFGNISQNRIVLDVKDPEKYHYTANLGSRINWMRRNAHCFEFMYPLGTVVDSKPLLKELAAVFKVKFGYEQRLVDVLVLKRVSQEDKLKAKSIKASFAPNGFLQSAPMSALVYQIDKDSKWPVVDETQYKYKIDIDLDITDWTDLNILSRKLRKYGLDLFMEKREEKMFVITDKNLEK